MSNYAENYLANRGEIDVSEYITIKWGWSTPTGKTSIYVVTNNRTESELGLIRWHGPWRQYVFVPRDGTIYSSGCLRDIDSFIEKLHEARRERLLS